MPRGHKSKLRAREKRRQNRPETQSLKSVQPATGEEEEDPCCSSSTLEDASSSSTGAGPLQAPLSDPATTSAAAGVSGKRSARKGKGRFQKSKSSSQAKHSPESVALDLLTQKACKLVEYLLYQYIMQKPMKKVDMLKIVHKWYKKDFSEILQKASEHIDMVYALELKEVTPNGNYYTLVDNQKDTDGGGPSRGWTFPIRGILMPILSVLFLNGDSTPEEEIWEFLNMMEIYDGEYHFIFGEPRQLITQDLVKEQYLVYQQVPNSDPPCYEFLWGPKAHAECSKMKILEFLAKLHDKDPTDFPTHYEEALRDDEERAQARAQAETKTARPSKTSGHPTASSSHLSMP